MMFFKLVKDEKVVSLGQLPMMLEGAECIEIGKEEYDLLKQDFARMDNINLQIEELKFWFDSFYARNEQKLRRLIALGKLDDDGKSPQEKLDELFSQAEIKRKQIQDLESQYSTTK